MLKCLAIALAVLSIPVLQGAQFVSVWIEYAERPGPQGLYLLGCDDAGLVSLMAVDNTANLPEVKVGEIVPVLEKAFPWLAGKITAKEIEVDTAKLVKDGKVHVIGQVKETGDHPAASLGDCMAAAKPTEFGAVMRIEVIRKGKTSLYDLKKKDHAGIKLEPGDVVHVPMKKVVGR